MPWPSTAGEPMFCPSCIAPLQVVVELHPADILHPLRGQRLATAIDRNGPKRERLVLESVRVRWGLTPVFFLRRQPRNFENATLVARRRVHFRGFLAIFLVSQLPPKRGLLLHKNSLASYQRCSHSVEPRALTCPFKQSNLSARSYPNL